MSRRTTDRPLPTASRLGIVVIGLGLLLDVSQHSFGNAAAGAQPEEHAAHLVVIVGMVVVLLGIVADGVRASRGRSNRPERSPSHAIR